MSCLFRALFEPSALILCKLLLDLASCVEASIQNVLQLSEQHPHPMQLAGICCRLPGVSTEAAASSSRLRLSSRCLMHSQATCSGPAEELLRGMATSHFTDAAPPTGGALSMADAFQQGVKDFSCKAPSAGTESAGTSASDGKCSSRRPSMSCLLLMSKAVFPRLTLVQLLCHVFGM